jgi:hypothetical protein
MPIAEARAERAVEICKDLVVARGSVERMENASGFGPPSGGREGPGMAAAAALAVAGLAFPSSAHASFLQPDMMSKVAMYLAWFIIVFVPIRGIVLFWLVHIVPEKYPRSRRAQSALQYRWGFSAQAKELGC